MITFVNAKINLGLNIVSKRPDGYHDLETIFYPIPLQDVLEITELDRSANLPYTFNQSGFTVEGDPEKNLIIKAYRLLKNDFNLPPINIAIHKNIPFGAGLGGGSADAAFMLKLLNTYFNLGIGLLKLEEYAALLGADCAFFIQNKPVYAEGIGNVFTPVSLNLKGYQLYVVKPDIFVSTAEAFSNIKAKPTNLKLKEIIEYPIEQWKDLMVNDFEERVFELKPQLNIIKENMYHAGASYAAMSGSGSSIYGLFKPGTCKLKSDELNGKYLLEL